MRNRFSLRITCVLSILILGLNSPLLGQISPPSTAPEAWGAVSINMEEIEYPYPVNYFNFSVYGQDVRVAYMDVAPKGQPWTNGYFSSWWALLRVVLGKSNRSPFFCRLPRDSKG